MSVVDRMLAAVEPVVPPGWILRKIWGADDRRAGGLKLRFLFFLAARPLRRLADSLRQDLFVMLDRRAPFRQSEAARRQVELLWQWIRTVVARVPIVSQL